jgi:hypothetical protein
VEGVALQAGEVAWHVEQMSPVAVMGWAYSDAEPAGEDWAQVATTHVCVPLGFEARTSVFGPRTRTFLREVAEVADVASSSHLYHWCAMVGKLAQGEASLVLGAVASARTNAHGFSGWKASPEWSPTNSQSCVSF